MVAPSSPFDGERLRQGCEWLQGRGYRLSIRGDIYATRDYLAGDDERRGGELREALADGASRAIVAARGGYGALRLLAMLPAPLLAAANQWVVGFSDVTVLLAAAVAAGIACVHGPMLASLGAAPERQRERWLGLLEGRHRPHWRGLAASRSAALRGPAFGGNLSVLYGLAAARALTPPPGAVWFLEDCNEAPYRIDRMLTALRLGGYLEGAQAVVLGAFTGVKPEQMPLLERVLDDRLRTLPIPVLAGAPFGHIEDNEAFFLGVPAIVEAAEVHF